MKTSSVLTPDQYADLITRLTDHVVNNCTAVDVEARFDDLVNDIHRDCLTGPFAFLSPAAVMKEMMPTDYRCGVADMTGTDDTLREIRGEYYDEDKVEEARASFVAALRAELDDAERDLLEEENDEVDIKELNRRVAIYEAQIDAAERHAF